MGSFFFLFFTSSEELVLLVTEDPKKEVMQGFGSEKKKRSTKSYIMEQIKREREREKDAQSMQSASYNKGLKREICSHGRGLLLGLKLFCRLAGCDAPELDTRLQAVAFAVQRL